MCAFKPMFSHPAWKRPWPKMFIDNKNSIAYRMALVSSGRFDSMMALNTKSDWDIAAGVVIVKEAGGFVDFFNNDIDVPLKKNILATNSNIHDDLSNLIKKNIE